MALAFIGVVAILRPSFTGIEVSAFYGLMGGLFAGLAYTVVRRLKDDASPYTMTFYFMTFSTLASLPFVWAEGFSVLHVKEIVLLVFMGLCMSLGQLLLSYAYRFVFTKPVRSFDWHYSISRATGYRINFGRYCVDIGRSIKLL